jgi:hypothetical protein
MEQTLQTVVEIYVASLKDRRKYANNLSEASRADIEQDVACWFSGFTAAVKLVDPKSSLPALDTVLSAVTKRFAEEGIAA